MNNARKIIGLSTRSSIRRPEVHFDGSIPETLEPKGALNKSEYPKKVRDLFKTVKNGVPGALNKMEERKTEYFSVANLEKLRTTIVSDVKAIGVQNNKPISASDLYFCYLGVLGEWNSRLIEPYRVKVAEKLGPLATPKNIRYVLSSLIMGVQHFLASNVEEKIYRKCEDDLGLCKSWNKR